MDWIFGNYLLLLVSSLINASQPLPPSDLCRGVVWLPLSGCWSQNTKMTAPRGAGFSMDSPKMGSPKCISSVVFGSNSKLLFCTSSRWKDKRRRIVLLFFFFFGKNWSGVLMFLIDADIGHTHTHTHTSHHKLILEKNTCRREFVISYLTFVWEA